jgi:hypothetical protein
MVSVDPETDVHILMVCDYLNELLEGKSGIEVPLLIVFIADLSDGLTLVLK